MAKVSIVIPAYNCATYLPTCLDSIRNQTFTDWECVIVDDGSADNTLEICNMYAEKDKRYKIFHKENGGPSSARKYGVERASGEWIFFSDSDDFVPEDSLLSLISKDNGCNEIIAGTILYENTNILYYTKSRQKEVNPDLYVKYLLDHTTYIGPCSKLIKKPLFERFNWNTDKRITNLEDLLMLIGLSTKTQNDITLLNDSVNYIRIARPNSCSMRPMKYEGCKLLLQTILITLSEANKLTEELKIAYLQFAFRLLKSMCLKHKRWFKTDEFILYLKNLADSTKGCDISNLDKKIIFSKFYRALYILKRYVR